MLNKVSVENFLAKIFWSAIILTTTLGWAEAINAQNQCNVPCPPNSVCIPNPLRWCSIHRIIDEIIKFLWYLSWPFAFLFILIGAFYIGTGGGNPERLRKGKRIIIYALIGLILINGARAILATIRNILGAS